VSPCDNPMRVECLSPIPDQQTRFAWSHHTTVPDQPGCYALVTYHGDVLYVGLATRSIRSRMGSHLDTLTKRQGNNLGAPFWFYYILRPATDVAPIERGWMNQAILENGEMPPLNRVYSPIQ
jgi:hypothetical protein